MLLNLPTDPCHPDRALPADQTDADPDASIADLLWFPTGGGMAEAHLGIPAYPLTIRACSAWWLGGATALASLC